MASWSDACRPGSSGTADDFVICCRQTAAQGPPFATQQLQALGLTLHPAKTRVLDARQRSFSFLGFTGRVARSWRRGTWFPLTQPSAAACQELRDAVKALTGRDRARRPTPDVITEVNRGVQGWGGDLPLPPLHGRVQRPQRVRLQSGPHLPAAQASASDRRVSRLPICLAVWAVRSLPAPADCAVDGSGVCRAVKVIGEPAAGNPHVRFDEGVLAFGPGRAREAPPDERGGHG